MRPWARYVIDFIDHAKFNAISGNAICLWIEGKNYCDKHHTDGLIPKAGVKQFRFYGPKNMAALMRSCGEKVPGMPYAPLWEEITLGDVDYVRMHDFLEHNECRDAVLARIEKADGERARKLANQQAYRERRKTDPLPAALPVTLPVTVVERSAVLPDKQKQLQNQNQNTQEHEDARADALTVFESYQTHWERTYGHASSLILSALEQMKLEQQLDKFPGAKLLPALAAYFLTDDPYVLKQKHPLGLFVRDPTRYLAKEAAPAKISREAEAEAVLAIVKRRDAGDFS